MQILNQLPLVYLKFTIDSQSYIHNKLIRVCDFLWMLRGVMSLPKLDHSLILTWQVFHQRTHNNLVPKFFQVVIHTVPFWYISHWTFTIWPLNRNVAADIQSYFCFKWPYHTCLRQHFIFHPWRVAFRGILAFHLASKS